jgi:hypothetical protein
VYNISPTADANGDYLCSAGGAAAGKLNKHTDGKVYIPFICEEPGV